MISTAVSSSGSPLEMVIVGVEWNLDGKVKKISMYSIIKKIILGLRCLFMYEYAVCLPPAAN